MTFRRYDIKVQIRLLTLVLKPRIYLVDNVELVVLVVARCESCHRSTMLTINWQRVTREEDPIHAYKGPF